MVSAHGASLAMFPFQSVKRVATRNEAIEYVESAIRRDGGADFFKVVLDQPGLDVEIIAAATTTAQRLGKLVMGHASQVAAYRLALQTGCDMVTPVPLDGPLDEDMVRELAQRGIGVIPTLAFLRKAVTEGRMPQVAYEHAKTAVRALRQAGVSVCAGSSSNPCSENGEVAVAHGSGLMEELHLLEVDGGMTRPELLRAATSAPAALFRLADRGVIAEGRRADMLLVRGSPLEGAGLSNRILKVWVAGVEV
ncbi:hypothetical protein XA68_18414 [Ophiocordyceps unilateralis]|uniref:Amidohydrolase 3 domain-containing protein n=1 Tax=Ophiocordyceps unilateralis TaxID=268505 RepID=A0A2A9PJJ9_OPHUN|nr:hypothetical protein XA68_18414 [Ophiocordyceps unilateralis]